MKLTYKEFLTFFNKSLAQENNLVVQFEEDDFFELSLNPKTFTVLLADDKESGLRAEEDPLSERVKMIVDTLMIVYERETYITFDFCNYPITKQTMRYLLELISDPKCPKLVSLSNFSDIDEDALKIFSDTLKNTLCFPRLCFDFNSEFTFTSKNIHALAYAFGTYRKNDVALNFRDSHISKEDLALFSEILFSCDLSEKNNINLMLPLGDYIPPLMQGFSKLSKKNAPKNLVFQLSNVKEKDAEQLRDALKDRKEMPHLEFRFDGIDELDELLMNDIDDIDEIMDGKGKTFLMLMDILSEVPNLHFLIESHFPESELIAWTQMLKNGKFRYGFGLDLLGVEFTDNLLENLWEALESGKCPNDMSIGFLNDGILVFTFERLVEALQHKNCPSGLRLRITSAYLTDKHAQVIIDFLNSGNYPRDFDITLESANFSQELNDEIKRLCLKINIKQSAESCVVIQKSLDKPHVFNRVPQAVLSNVLYPYLLSRDISEGGLKHFNKNIEKIPKNISSLPSVLFKSKEKKDVPEIEHTKHIRGKKT